MTIAAQQLPPPGGLVLDHISHFVPDLAAASALLEQLGFVVTAESAQRTPEGPVGASNRCVMLENGYVEILAPTHDTPPAQRMRAAMARHAGVHLACFGTPDAEGEHRRLQDHGFAPQPLVDLSRQVEDGRTVRFKVVRPAPEHMPEGRIQHVQHMTPEVIWTDRHLAHDNGVVGLAGIFVVADDPVAAAARWARFSALLPYPEGNLIKLKSSRGQVVIATAAQFQDILGKTPIGPALAGYELACADPDGFAQRCKQAGLQVTRSKSACRVALPAALGGTWRLIRSS